MNEQNDEDLELEDIITDLDPPYESREELKIGRLLDQYGLPFFYKQPTIIYDQSKNEIWHPTFTLPTYDSLVIDYITPSQGEDYQSRIQRTKQIYEQNQMPAILLTQQDLNNPNWQQKLYEELEQISHQRPDYALHNNR